MADSGIVSGRIASRRTALVTLALAAMVAPAPAAAQGGEMARQQAALTKAMQARDWPAAGAALDRIVALNRAAFGPDHPNTLVPLETRAAVAGIAGDAALSEKLYREALAARARIGAPPDEQIALDNNGLAQAIDRQGRYTEAEPFYRRALDIRQKSSPPDSRELALSYNNLATNLANSAKNAEAEALFRKALAINVAREGPEGETVASSITNLGSILAAQGRYADAEAEHRKALAVRLKTNGPKSDEVGTSYNNIGFALANQGKFAEAEPILRQAIAIRGSASGEKSFGAAESIGNLASVLQAQGKAEAAEPLFRKVAAIFEGLVGRDHPVTLTAQSNLATDLVDQARLAEALPILRRVYDVRRRALGPDHPETATAAINLATIMERSGDILAAEPLFREALAINRKALGENHDRVATADNNLAENLMAQGRFEEAEALHRKALAIRLATLGDAHPDTADSLNNIANALGAQRRYAEAKPLLERSLAINQQRFGPDSLRVASGLNNIAGNKEELGEVAAATPLYQRALAIRRKGLGPSHPAVALSLNNLGYNAYALGRTKDAATYYQQAEAVYRKAQGPNSLDALTPANNLAIVLTKLGGADDRALAIARASAKQVAARRLAIAAGAAAGTDAAAQAALRARADTLLDADPSVTAFITLTQVDWAVAGRQAGQAEALKAEAFSAAQQINVSQAGQAMARTAARTAAGTGPLGQLVARQQDAAARIVVLESRYSAATTRGDLAAANTVTAEVQGRATELSAIDAEIRQRFPDYAGLIAPGALAVAEVQARLQPGEGLLFIAASNGDLFSFAVSRTSVAWNRAEKRQEGMKQDVNLLLCQMDQYSCTADAQKALPPETPMQKQGRQAFSRATAYGLYRDLIAPVESALTGVKRLYVTTPGYLGRLPLELLVTAAPAPGDDADPALLTAAPWLGDRYALTMLPSISTLRALQRSPVAQQGSAGATGSLVFRGYGAPRLGTGTAASRGAGARGAATLRGLFRAGEGGMMADPAMLRQLDPLPGTRTELIAMAQVLGAPQSALRLDTAASEAAVHADSGLGQARVIAFATHGLLADEVPGVVEPGLVLTPPATASRLDDGILTASEASALRLSADWVILSACNTAAASGSADSLSSLSRAFLYAGARSLLASHWRVSDDATAVLTVETLRADEQLSRAESLQSAARAVRTGKRRDGTAVPGWTADWAHPMMWAPFSLISTADE